MRHQDKMDSQALFHLVSKLEAMMEKGRVFFPHEEQYHDLINYFEGEYLFDIALEVAGFGIRQFELSPDLHLRKAELLLQTGQAEQALATLDKCEMLVPGLLTNSLLRAEALAELDMHTEALELLENLHDQVDGSDRSLVYTQEALICHIRKEYEKEYFLLETALREDHTNQEALSRMWYCVEAARKHRQSVALHQEIIEKDPFSSLAWYNLGASQQFLTNYEEAIEAFEYAFLTNPTFEFAYRACADVCMDTRNFQKALQCYQELLETCEPDDDLFLCIGKCYENLKNYPVARTFFEQAVAFNPFSGEAFYHIGTCYAAQKKWKKAIQAYLKAIQANETDENCFAALGEAYFQSGQYAEAERFFKAAVDNAPDFPDYWIRLARFFLDTQRTEQALEVLDEAEENTFDPEILYYRSAFLFKLEKKREALLVLEEALAEDFYAHGALFSLMPVLARDSDVKAVISIFQPE